jgi:hypothetical protein
MYVVNYEYISWDNNMKIFPEKGKIEKIMSTLLESTSDP